MNQPIGIEIPRCGSYGCKLEGGVKSERWGRYLCAEHAVSGPVPEPSITCPVCGMKSWHPMDVKYGWCSACHSYTSRGAQ